MIGDIKTTIEILEYPKVEKFESISDEKIIKFIENNIRIYNKYKENREYYIGRNTAIVKKRTVDEANPDSRVAVSYARTMTQIVKGYMYKPGLITYSSENESYMARLQEIFDLNNEELKTSELGEGQAKYGLGLELLYTKRNNDIKVEKTIPRFTFVDPSEVILIFNMEIEASLIGAIRYYIIEKDELNSKIVYQVEVYYIDRVEIWKMTDTIKKKEVVKVDEYENFFHDIPFVMYKNNQEFHADYEPQKPLIDAYDSMCSDAMNELNRFASAYLILKNYILSNSNDDNEKKKVLERLKSFRVFEVQDDGEIKFLTKDIPSEFFQVIKQTLREDIEYHSHIPDFRGKNFEAKSGVALKWSLLDFENLASDKQALFEVGLQRRIKLINNILKIKGVDDETKVDIKFERNVPANNTESIDNFVKLAGTQKLADEDLLRMLPSDVIPDIQAALDRLKIQKEENMAMFDLDKGMEEENKMEDEDEG